MAGQVQHIVLLKFPSELSEDDVAEMYAHVRSWPDQIPGFTKLRLGRDMSGRSLGYQYLLVTEFESEEALQAYFPHPVHQRFAQWVHSRGTEVLAFDYALDEGSLLAGD